VRCWAADCARRVEGDFVECGVNTGYSARSVMEYTGFRHLSDKTFYLLDTFDGLSEKYLTPEEKSSGKANTRYEGTYEAVKKTFQEFSNVRIIKGAVPETLSEVQAKRVAYLSLDMNCVKPEIAAAEFFWDKMPAGGVILLDDYVRPGFEELEKAYDEFAREKGVGILSLPTGQGLILKD
jgi:O-methyltransferase